MPTPIHEVPAGAIDGVNTLYTVSQPYVASTLAVFLNGQLKRKDLADGWVELVPGSGTFQLNQAPQLGDVVQAYYLAEGGQSPVVEITLLQGRLTTMQVLRAALVSADPLVGVLSC